MECGKPGKEFPVPGKLQRHAHIVVQFSNICDAVIQAGCDFAIVKHSELGPRASAIAHSEFSRVGHALEETFRIIEGGS